MATASRKRTIVIAVLIATSATVLGGLLQESKSTNETNKPEPSHRPEAKRDEPGRNGRAPDPDIPRLIGMRPSEVREAIEPLSLPISFSGGCDSHGPAGRVTYHLPGPHGNLHLKDVRVWMDHKFVCGNGRAESPCTAAQLDLDVGAHQAFSPDHSGKDLVMTLKNTGSRACRLEATAVGMLRGPDGLGDEIRGNPWRITFDAALKAGERIGTLGVAIAHWQHWCGEHGRWRQVVTILGVREQSDVWTPGCTSSYWGKRSFVD